MERDVLLSALTLAALVYGGLCAFFYFGQDFFFFRPERLPKWFAYEYPFPFREINFDMEDGGVVNALHFQIPNSKGVVFYIKGNSRSIKGWGKFARDFVGKGYDFFIMDFRGFGKSRGRRTESILYSDLQQVYKWLAARYGEERIVLYGRSLGSGLAARIASWNNPSLLILDCPYYSFLYHISRYGFWLPLRWLLRYHIRTDLFIRKAQCPVYILHGKRDRLIPYRQSEMLQALSPDNIHLIPIEGAGHNNLTEFPEYHDHLYDILHMKPAAVRLAKTDRA
ncbi:MAG: alpha/beta hydrolase [Saprospiraceae bacterium]|nr:alpha/beta hydrolase [Saprospiraceae bacterium]MDW8230246.1 alpha/beta hydrolase [Saprospiraceae bacterium]